jgi:hypothetical protein
VSNPNEIKLNSHTKFWFDCECGHQFEIALNCLNNGSWCPYCSKPSKKICDENKMKCANENGFSVIRIMQEDIYKDKYDWLTELINNIEKITNDNSIQNIYMCKNNEYKDFVV